MRPLSYPAWDLRHLTLSFNIWSADPNKLCVTAILKALPGLQTFNGIPKQNYLDQLSREMRDAPHQQVISLLDYF